MNVIWHQKAIIQRFIISKYISDTLGRKAMAQFNREVTHCKNLIAQNPNIASIEQYLEGSAVEYRSILVSGLSKMIYYYEGDTVYVAAIWDVRRNPEEMAYGV